MAGLIDYFRLLIHQRFYSEARIKKYQQKQLKKLVGFAVRKSPFYRDLYQSKPVDTLEDFRRLPLINKQIMMDHLSQLNTIGADKEELIRFALEAESSKEIGYYQDEYVVGMSSGTSGSMGIYLTSKKLTRKLPFVFLARSGIPLSLLPYNILFFLRVHSQAFEDINSPFIKLKYMSTMTEISQAIDEINRRRINILMAPPSFLRLVLPQAHEIKKKPEIILTYAEVLTPEEKGVFRERFGCPVIEIYQASEGQMASTCHHGNLHINEDLVYIELCDEQGREVSDTTTIPSKMIVTNLVNRAQPLIRYEMNDLVRLGEKCPCGSNFRVIRQIIGRSDDILYFTSDGEGEGEGEIIHVFPDLFARWVITQNPNIREFRVVNNKINQVTVTIDLFREEPEAGSDLKARLLAELSGYKVPSPDIEVVCAPISLPTDKNKYKRFRREF